MDNLKNQWKNQVTFLNIHGKLRDNTMHIVQKRLLKLAKTEDIGQYGYRKLGEKVKEPHPQKIKWHLQKLLKDGYLYKDGFGAIRVAEDNPTARLARVPILGLANCGEPLSFADNTQHGYLTISPGLLGSRNVSHLFAVQATGDSMNACNVQGSVIEDGDYVVVDNSVEAPKTGDYVVSSIEGLANIKKFVRDDQNHVIALVSESTKPRPPIVVSEADAESYRVHGKVVAVIKSYA